MVSSEATTVEDYLDELDDGRRELVEAVRATVLDHLPAGYEEVMRWGMITYEVPLERFPDTYNGQPLMYAALASQKRHVSLYLTTVYADPARSTSFQERWLAAVGKLDMGKSCVRFHRLDAVALEVVADVIAETSVDDFVALHDTARN